MTANMVWAAMKLLLCVAPAMAFVLPAGPSKHSLDAEVKLCLISRAHRMVSCMRSSVSSRAIGGFRLPRRRVFVTSSTGRRMSGQDSNEAGVEDGVDFDSLMDMDLVLFSRRKNDSEEDSEVKLELGALQEDGTLAPISAWTLESAFAGGSDSIEFLVDEEDRFPGLTGDDVKVHSVLDESLLGYGSRQVGGGKGPGNPHGEESELLYYIDRRVLEGNCDGLDGKEIDVVIKPELEILW